MIKTWNERCEEHPDHQTGMVSHLMIQARMQEEIDALRAALAEPVQAKFDDVAVEQWKLRMVFYDENGEPLMSRQPEPDEILAALTEPAEPVQEPYARKPPATIDEMFDRMDKAPKGVFFGHDPMTIWMEAWRAAEQHHGIKEEK